MPITVRARTHRRTGRRGIWRAPSPRRSCPATPVPSRPIAALSPAP